jgi:hypothetical protein
MESSGIFRGPLEPSRPVEKLTESTVIPVDGVTLQADLVVPYDALGIVVFAASLPRASTIRDSPLCCAIC